MRHLDPVYDVLSVSSSPVVTCARILAPFSCINVGNMGMTFQGHSGSKFMLFRLLM